MKSSTIYLSDLLSVPMPKHAVSHADYIRKVKNRRILWALLPYLVRGLCIACFLCLSMAGLTVMVVGIGG